MKQGKGEKETILYANKQVLQWANRPTAKLDSAIAYILALSILTNKVARLKLIVVSMYVILILFVAELWKAKMTTNFSYALGIKWSVTHLKPATISTKSFKFKHVEFVFKKRQTKKRLSFGKQRQKQSSRPIWIGGKVCLLSNIWWFCKLRSSLMPVAINCWQAGVLWGVASDWLEEVMASSVFVVDSIVMGLVIPAVSW